MSGSITSADAIFILTVPELGIVGHKLQGFAVDKAFSSENKIYSETQVGVDGKLSAGYTPTKTTMMLTLQADSDSRKVMNAILEAMETSKKVYYMSGVITLPATNENFSLTRGAIVSGKKSPDAAKLLQPIDYSIDWESVRVSEF